MWIEGIGNNTRLDAQADTPFPDLELGFPCLACVPRLLCRDSSKSSKSFTRRGSSTLSSHLRSFVGWVKQPDWVK